MLTPTVLSMKLKSTKSTTGQRRAEDVADEIFGGRGFGNHVARGGAGGGGITHPGFRVQGAGFRVQGSGCHVVARAEAVHPTL